MKPYCSKAMIEKYEIVFLDKPVLCKCGKPVMVADLCWRCWCLKNKDLDYYKRRFEPDKECLVSNGKKTIRI